MNKEFKTRLQIGNVVIVDYCNSKLNYSRKYTSIVKDITMDIYKDIYTCRLNNFNMDFQLINQTDAYIHAASYDNKEEKIFCNVYTIEYFENRINRKNDIYRMYEENNAIYLNDIIKDYQILIEAIKLERDLEIERLQNLYDELL